MARLLDTNAILRYVAGDAAEQAEAARNVVQNVAQGKEQAIVLHNVIHEACYALTSSTPGQGYNLTHRDARDRLQPILALDGIQIIPDKRLALQALDIYALGEKIDFTDALLVADVRNAMADGIYSFDKRYDTIAGANRLDPRAT